VLVYCKIDFVFQQFISRKNDGDKVVVFERAEDLVFIFNFHPTNSFPDYKIGVGKPGTYPFYYMVIQTSPFSGYQ